MAMLTRDQILTVNDRKTETVSVPEWGGDVLVAVMSGEQRDIYESLITEVDASGKARHKLDNLRAKLVSCSLVDEDGNLMFSPADVQQLGKKSASALQRVYEVATRINRTTEDQVEEAAKNS